MYLFITWLKAKIWRGECKVRLRGIASAILSLSLLVTPTLFNHNVSYAKSVKSNSMKQYDAFNPTKEKDKLDKMGYKGEMNLTKGHDVTLKFDDGSKITYSLTETDVPSSDSSLLSPNFISSNVITSYVYKSFTFTKTLWSPIDFSYIIFQTHAKFAQHNVWVTGVDSAFDGIMAHSTGQHTSTLVGHAIDPYDAVTQLKGTFESYIPKIGRYADEAYEFRMHIDTGGSDVVYIMYY